MRNAWLFILSAVGGFMLGRVVLAPAKVEVEAEGRGAGLTTNEAVVGAEGVGVPEREQSPRERLEAVLSGDDPLSCAARMLAWLNSATAEDFRELAGDMSKFPVPTFSGFDWTFRYAFHEALMKRWMDVDADGALSAALAYREYKRGHADRRFGGEQADWLLDGISRAKPEFALQKLPLVDGGGVLERYAHAAFIALGERDANAARRFLGGIADAKQRSAANDAIVLGMAQSDPLAAVALAGEMKAEHLYDAALTAAQKIGAGMVRRVLAAAPEHFANSSQLPRLLFQYPDLMSEFTGVKPIGEFNGAEDDLDRIATQATAEERERLLASYDAMPEHMRGELAAPFASVWACKEPAKAAEWALARAEPMQLDSKANKPSQDVFARWFRADSDAAIAWWRTMPPSPLRDFLGNHAGALMSDEGRIEEALAVFHPVEGEGQAETTEMLAQNYARRDPAAAAAWLGMLPAGVDTKDAVHTVVDRWTARDPEAVAGWIETLPAGKMRDEAVTKFLIHAVMQDSAGAAEWVEQVSDPDLRKQSAQWVYSWMCQQNPAGAREWIRQLPGVDTEWRDRFLRTHP